MLEINLIPWDLGNYNIQTSKFYFWGVFFIFNLLTQKLIKIICFFFFWVFGTSLSNQVEHTWPKSQLHISDYEWAKILFFDRGLNP
jgi:hypothetical protein